MDQKITLAPQGLSKLTPNVFLLWANVPLLNRNTSHYQSLQEMQAPALTNSISFYIWSGDGCGCVVMGSRVSDLADLGGLCWALLYFADQAHFQEPV